MLGWVAPAKHPQHPQANHAAARNGCLAVTCVYSVPDSLCYHERDRGGRAAALPPSIDKRRCSGRRDGGVAADRSTVFKWLGVETLQAAKCSYSCSHM